MWFLTRKAASDYLKSKGDIHGTVIIDISIGKNGIMQRDGEGRGSWRWGVKYSNFKFVSSLILSGVFLLLHSSVFRVSFHVGDGPGSSYAWGCDLSYDYVKINVEYTT